MASDPRDGSPRLEAGEGDAPARPRPSRSAAKDAAARAALVPLREGERPRAVTFAAAVAAALAVANVAAWLAGAKIGHRRPAAPGIFSYSILMGTAAWGLWRSRYWAVIGMEALLGIVILIFSVLLLTASNALTVAIALAVIVPSGALFWFLVRAMARIQMRDRPPG